MLGFVTYLGFNYDYFLYGMMTHDDEWTNKTIKNYEVYQDFKYQTPPTLDGRLSEEKLWKMNQPGYLRATPERFL